MANASGLFKERRGRLDAADFGGGVGDTQQHLFFLAAKPFTVFTRLGTRSARRPRPPRAISHVVGRLKSLSARALFKEFPSVKRKLWGGELWEEDGYFVRTVGDKVTAEVIRQYIRRHKAEPDPQLTLF